MIVLRILDLYVYIIFARIIISWVYPNPYNPFVRFLYSVTDPVLTPIRRIIPPLGGMIDLSPMVVIIVIEMLKRVIINLLYY